MERNPQTSLKVQHLFFPAQVTATTTLNNSAPNLNVDTLGFEEALIIAVVGAAVTAGTDTITVQMKESATDDGLGYTNITGAAFAALTGTGDNTQRLGRLKLEGRKRYLSATLTEAGTFDGIVGIIVVLIGPRDTTQDTIQSYDFSVV